MTVLSTFTPTRIEPEQIEQFQQDGFLLLDCIVDPTTAHRLRGEFDRMFRGEFEIGTLPDEVNWQEGKSDPTLTRQICNGWRASRLIASIVLREDFGHALARLMGWRGTRIMSDNILWKPVGARSLNFHQDNSYLSWYEPTELCTLWITLDDITPDNGTMELVRGSHRWQHSEPEGEFHGPEDYRAPMRNAARRQNLEPDIVPVAVPCGGGSIHHGWVWHGSGTNHGTSPRRSVVLHAMPSDVLFKPANFSRGTGPIYSRYAKLGSLEMDENYFPTLWREDGYRTKGIDAFIGGPGVS
ncbi:MAG: phytanoyl-CoA dioxygenase family protein [Gammaproteobacteria bacterium]|nr:phytanoyl-CoA dioxygenase family protein [Gammaproteobacteria bacterium]MDH3465465.1 phytanoyl-CoA dioxygenase family protein [Gammaproteobacteria bacterium]